MEATKSEDRAKQLVERLHAEGWMLAPEGRIVWLCPECWAPSESGPESGDEENRPCDCGTPLRPFMELPDMRPSD